MADDQDEEKQFVSKVGPIAVDWPRTIGYYGAIGAALALEVISPPIAVIIAAVPLVKLMKRRRASLAERFVAAIFEGAAKPIGGDAEGVVRPAWVQEEKEKEDERKSRLDALADRSANGRLPGGGAAPAS